MYKNKLLLILLGLSTPILSFAQRMRARPEDYENYPDYGSSSADMPPAFWIVLLVILVIGIIWFKSALNSSRKEEIRAKTLFLTNMDIYGYESPNMAMNHSFYSKPKEYLKVEKRVVKIPKYSRCIILEYYPENRSYVKVKFEDYPQPLYIDRGHLRTPADINT